ncbi:MAG: nuclear transport factor 2-like protein [Candidatus Geothermincolia bacterium]
MKTRDIMSDLRSHWESVRAGRVDAELEIYAEDAVCDFPQSGETVVGRDRLKLRRLKRKEEPESIEFLRILGSGNLWVSECLVTYGSGPVYLVSVMEFSGGKVFHETQYFGPPLEASE